MQEYTVIQENFQIKQYVSKGKFRRWFQISEIKWEDFVELKSMQIEKL